MYDNRSLEVSQCYKEQITNNPEPGPWSYNLGSVSFPREIVKLCNHASTPNKFYMSIVKSKTSFINILPGLVPYKEHKIRISIWEIWRKVPRRGSV